MEIRPATAEDVPMVLPMVARICAFHESLDPAKYALRGDPQEMYRGWLVSRSRDRNSVFLVAEARDDPLQLAGFLVGTVENEIPIYRLQKYGFIHDLWVEPQYRNEGIARQMVSLAIERFGTIGVEQIRLDTAAGNEVAKSLFRSCGFRESVVEMLLQL
jgi:ribosomal protein S18 acetylase RimI-like enzyme